MMRWTDHVKIAFGSLWQHPLRTGLTMLGIIIGVAAVVAMVSIGMGANARIEEEITRLGSNLLMVLPGSRMTNGISTGTGGQHTLTEGDARALAIDVYGLQVAVPTVTGSVRVIAGKKNWRVRLIGTNPGYLEARDWLIERGRNMTTMEERTSAKVAVVGKSAEVSLGGSLLGKIVRINSVPFRVIGILETKGVSATGSDQDNIIIVPLSSAKSRLIGGYHQVNRGAVEYILVKGVDADGYKTIRAAIERVLRYRHAIPKSLENDFVVHDPGAIYAVQKKASDTVAKLLAFIASANLQQSKYRQALIPALNWWH